MEAGMCRLCASENESMISMMYQWETISQKLSACCGIHIQMDDTLPQSVCQECMGCLNASYKFYIQVQDAQQTLQSYIARPQQHDDQTNFMGRTTLVTNSTRKTLNDKIRDPKVRPAKTSDRRIRKETISFNKCKSIRPIQNDPLLTIANVTSLASNNDLPEEYILPEETNIKTELQNDPLQSKTENDVEPYRKEIYIALPKIKKEPSEIHECDAENEDNVIDKDLAASEMKKINPKGQLLRRVYKCTICNKEFRQKRSLTNHKHIKQRKKYTRPQTKYYCSICNKEFTQLRGLRIHQSNHLKEQEVTCDYCGEVFSGIPSLELHLPIHSLDTEFKCHICQKRFTNFSLLEKHKKNVHNEIKKFKCTICSRSFRTKIEKNTHESDQHAGEMPYSCIHCDRRYRWSCKLDVHMAVHSNDRKYTCTFCNKSVKNMYSFKRHEQSCLARAEGYTKTMEPQSAFQ